VAAGRFRRADRRTAGAGRASRGESLELLLLVLFLVLLIVVFVKIIIKITFVEFVVVIVVVIVIVIVVIVKLVIIDASTGGFGLSMTIGIFIAFRAAGQLHLFNFLAAVVEITQIATHLPAPSLRRGFGARSRASNRAR